MDREQAIQTMAKPIASRLRSILVLRGMTSWSWENEDREVDAHARGAAKDIYDAGYRLPQEQAVEKERERIKKFFETDRYGSAYWKMPDWWEEAWQSLKGE